MVRRNRFRPLLGELEDRMVLSHGRGTFSVLTNNDQGRAFTLRAGRPAPIVTQVNTAFDQFSQDYSQVRSTYFAAISNKTATGADTGAFNQYTIQRVNLLAQQLMNSLLESTSSTLQGPRVKSSPLAIIGRRINGGNPGQSGNTTPFAAGTLGFALITSTPNSTSSSTTIALDSLAMDNAIEAARVAMVNGVNIIKNGDFGNVVKK